MVDEALVRLAREVKDGKTRSYVSAARVFADFVLKRAAEEKKRLELVKIVDAIGRAVDDDDTSQVGEALELLRRRFEE